MINKNLKQDVEKEVNLESSSESNNLVGKFKKILNHQIIKVSPQFKRTFFIVFAVFSLIIGAMNIAMIYEISQFNIIHTSNPNDPVFEVSNSKPKEQNIPDLSDKDDTQGNQSSQCDNDGKSTTINLYTLLTLLKSVNISLVDSEDSKFSSCSCTETDIDKAKIKNIYVLNQIYVPFYRIPLFVLEDKTNAFCTLHYNELEFDDLLRRLSGDKASFFDSVILIRDNNSSNSFSRFLITTPILKDNTLEVYIYNFRQNKLDHIKTFTVDKCQENFEPEYNIEYNIQDNSAAVEFFCSDTEHGYTLDTYKIDLTTYKMEKVR